MWPFRERLRDAPSLSDSGLGLPGELVGEEGEAVTDPSGVELAETPYLDHPQPQSMLDNVCYVKLGRETNELRAG
jgi:hypothetical protein